MWKGIPSHVLPWGIPWGYREAAHVESQLDDDRDAMQLSPRQRQVLQLLAEGRSMRETVVPQNLFRGADGSETTDPGDSVGRWTRRKDCNCGIGRYAQAECWRCVLFLNGIGAQDTDRSLLAAPSGTNAVVGR